jgi:hypothetical protein
MAALTVDELRREKRQLEGDIANFLASRLLEFRAKTDCPVQGIEVSFVQAQYVGRRPECVLNQVQVKLEDI